MVMQLATCLYTVYDKTEVNVDEAQVTELTKGEQIVCHDQEDMLCPSVEPEEQSSLA